ncbi:hypothetical protein [Bifidobacterium sp. ESL0745]|uniref:hypothetical protein n=1 Tax=Bifidobacterium sp. ESL0745 TaxID=2983226 RepID=UPI0023F9A7D9|nr:hypothetical protein [Bifidobacterium sp. ESL0745]MDF7665170.1 hypothetical protein [Bifidobacterium sp. ESL0745]
MSVNIIGLNEIQDSRYATKLQSTLGNYLGSYLLNDNHKVEDRVEDQTVNLLKECNGFLAENHLPKLCEIYDVFGLEQDAFIIYQGVVNHLIEKQQDQRFEITVREVK